MRLEQITIRLETLEDVKSCMNELIKDIDGNMYSIYYNGLECTDGTLYNWEDVEEYLEEYSFVINIYRDFKHYKSLVNELM
jgi:hypothetical protein